jgi:hypothetical protein
MTLDSDLTNTLVGKILDEREKDERDIATGILDFYLRKYPEVYVVICKKCKAKLCLEIADPSSPNQYHLHGRKIIELSPKYLAHRNREDGCEGYQCACGQDNRWAYIEWETLHHGGDHMYPHEIEMIKEAIRTTNYHPDVKIKGRDTIIENKFIVRKLK